MPNCNFLRHPRGTAIIAFFLLACAAHSAYIVPPASDISPALYGRWAHLHFVWNHNELSTQANVTQLISDYLSHNIKVGAVNIDSTWETQYNNFEPNPTKFSDFQQMVKDIHAQNIKITMWITSMVNVENPDYDYAVKNNFLVRNSTGQVHPLSWWHGDGGLLDYSNPEAVKWWHSEMDRVLFLPDGDGIDGFKCDGTDPYIAEYMLKGGALGYNDVPYTSPEQYSNYYYRDFLGYTRERRGVGNALIMSRPVDCLRDTVSAICWGYAPKDVMVAGWVGDDKSDWNGLRGAARKVIYSAWDQYANFAFDIGGYIAQDLAPAAAKELFIRWAQFGAFLPFMENGGGGEHRPWMYDEETLDIYRKFVDAHCQLSYYLQSVGSAALGGGYSTISPLEATPTPIRERSHRNYPQPTEFAYLLGPDIFVHPVLHESVVSAATGKTEALLLTIKFPAQTGSVWLDYWRPEDMKRSHKGGESAERLVKDLSDFPVYVRQGALLPLVLDVPQAGKSKQDELVVFCWYMPVYTTEPVAFKMRQLLTEGPGVEVQAVFASPSTMTVRVSAHSGKVGIRLVGLHNVVLTSASEGSGCAINDAMSSAGVTVVCADAASGVIFGLASL